MKTKTPSVAQLAMLSSISDHGDSHAHIRGQSAHGGAVATLASMERNGWIEWVVNTKDPGRGPFSRPKLTREGRRLLRAHRRELKHRESSIIAWGAALLAGNKRAKRRARR